MKDEVINQGSEHLSQYKRTKDYNYIKLIKWILKVNLNILYYMQR